MDQSTIERCSSRTAQIYQQSPRAAYVHVPFCRHRCGYCNFTLVAGRDDLVGDYLRAVALELSQLEPPQAVDTLYFGGGTPTHLRPAELRQLSKTILRRHPLVAGYEWTVEANPSDTNRQMIETLSALGVTRVSLGGQSFRTEKLRLLERDHTGREIEMAVDLTRREQMHVALDLIFATPGETLEEWTADLEAAISLRPNHISTYGLTFERGTAFWGRRLRGEFADVDEGLQRDMYAVAIDRLTAAGYEHYEVSNFARPGCRSRHNQVYWSGDGYFAYGPGAARYINGIRETNHRSTTTYLRHVLAGGSPVVEREQLLPEASARELLIFGLRRIDGVSRNDFMRRTGFQVDELVAQPLMKLIEANLLADDGEWIRLTREGLFVSDAIWPELL
jgi:oxygen-independent coproporphyrinogen III oxidase